jgi:hypothetical protein
VTVTAFEAVPLNCVGLARLRRRESLASRNFATEE